MNCDSNEPRPLPPAIQQGWVGDDTLFTRASYAVALAAFLLMTAIAGAADFERIEFAMPERCDGAVVVDVDSDGDLDLVGICRTEIVAVVLPEGKIRSVWKAEDGAMIHGAVWDADNDGDDDIAVCRFTRGSDFTIGWLENPSWERHPVSKRVDGTHGIAIGDLDGDGHDDLVSANVKGPLFPLSVSWFDGKTNSLQFLQQQKAGSRPHYLAIGDLDGDALPDVVLGDGGGFACYTNPGREKITTEWPRTTIARRAGGTNVALADIDGDGDLDVIGSCGHGVGIEWFENPGWKARPVETELSDIHALDAGDLDGDGDIDIAAGAFGGYQKPNDHKKLVRWYENEGSGKFVAHDLDTGNGQESYSLTVIDVDGDGVNDVILAGRGSNNLVWYRNEATLVKGKK